MLKRLIGLVVVLAVVSGASMAQAKPGGVARMIALGGGMPGDNIQVVINPFVFEDPVFTLVNPAYISHYKDYLFMNVAGGASYGGTSEGLGYQFTGINFGVTKDITLGATLSYDPTAYGTLRGILNNYIAGTGRPSNPADINPPPTVGGLERPEVFEVVGAFQVPGMTLGLGIMYGWSNSDFKSDDTTTGTTSEAVLGGHVLGFRGGVIWDMGGGNVFEGSALFRTESVKDNWSRLRTGDQNYSVGGTEFSAVARMKMKTSSKFSTIPYAGFLSFSAEPKQDAVPTGVPATKRTSKSTVLGFAFGIGGELKTPNVYLAGGVSYVYFRQQTEVSDSLVGTGSFTSTQKLPENAFPVINLGAEWWFTDWLAGRAGYFRAFNSEGQVTEFTRQPTMESHRLVGTSFYGSPIADYNNDNLVTLGIALKFGGFAMDATVSEDALRRGFGLIGASDRINTFGYVTLSYNIE